MKVPVLTGNQEIRTGPEDNIRHCAAVRGEHIAVRTNRRGECVDVSAEGVIEAEDAVELDAWCCHELELRPSAYRIQWAEIGIRICGNAAANYRLANRAADAAY